MAVTMSSLVIHSLLFQTFYFIHIGSQEASIGFCGITWVHRGCPEDPRSTQYVVSDFYFSPYWFMGSTHRFPWGSTSPQVLPRGHQWSTVCCFHLFTSSHIVYRKHRWVSMIFHQSTGVTLSTTKVPNPSYQPSPNLFGNPQAPGISMAPRKSVSGSTLTPPWGLGRVRYSPTTSTSTTDTRPPSFFLYHGSLQCLCEPCGSV